MEFVRVKNNGSKPISIAYNSRRTVINPGQEAIVEDEAAKIHFGNWDLRNDDRADWRHAEYRRLRGLAGCTDEGISALVDDKVWAERMPQVTLMKGDGTPIVGVLDDPSGESLPIQSNVDRDRELQMLREQVDRLINDRESERGSLPSLLVEDSPDTAPRRRGRPPQIQSSEAAEAD